MILKRKGVQVLKCTKWCWSVGDICNTTYWLSIERKPVQYVTWFWSFRPTYNGTTHGIMISVPGFVLLGHRRPMVTSKKSVYLF